MGMSVTPSPRSTASSRGSDKKFEGPAGGKHYNMKEALRRCAHTTAQMLALSRSVQQRESKIVFWDMFLPLGFILGMIAETGYLGLCKVLP